MENQILNLRRLALFVYRTLMLNLKTASIGVAGIFGLLLFISLATAYSGADNFSNLIPLYMTAFFLTGLINTSNSFKELTTAQKGYSWLMLPVSNFEKFFGSWLISGPLFIVIYFFFISIIYLLVLAKIGLLQNFPNLFSLPTLETVGSYLLVHTIFFLGACMFKSNAFLKTLLSIFLSAVCLVIAGSLIMLAIFNEMVTSKESWNIMNFAPDIPILAVVVKVMFCGIVPLFFLGVAYLKIKERQLS